MNNLITVFMNYKINRLVEYGVVVYQKNSPFIRDVLAGYFQTYIDNYYYGVFNTVEEEVYNRRNLKQEFNGVMEEMLYDFKEYESSLYKDVYEENQKVIRDLKEIAFELLPIDTLEFPNKDEIPTVMKEFIENHSRFSVLDEKIVDKLIRLVRGTYLMEQRLLQYKNNCFTIKEKHFVERDDCVWYELVPSIKSLEVYRNGLIEQVGRDENLAMEKMECLIQMISHMLLMNFLEKKETKKIFISLADSFVRRGAIDEKIQLLIDNPMFQKYVYLVVQYNTYANQKNAFSEDYHFAFIQDFSHISDVYMKVDSIYNEGLCHFLIVSKYKNDDLDFFTKYQNEVMSILMFEEE